MSLKSALFEMKEAIVNQQIGQSEELFIHELETKNGLSTGTLVFYFNHFMMLNLYNMEEVNQSDVNLKKINRKWSKNEMEFLFQYIKERQVEGALNITEILDEISLLLNRGYQSVNYKYYSLMKAIDKKQPEIQFTTITHKNVPVMSTEAIADENKVHSMISPKSNDLLDTLSGLITNVQHLPGINLNELLGSLLQLTNMALKNENSVQQVESMKKEISLEKEILQEKLRKKEQQLIREKRRNDQLQEEVSKLAKEIMAFNKLGDAAKIQNLKSYNQRLNYIIDNFGVVLQVGS